MAPKLGIVAGSGEMPARVVEICREQDRDVYVLALKGQTEPDFLEEVEHSWVRLGAAASGMDTLHAAGVTEVVLAGPVKRPSWSELRPDWRTAQWLAKLGKRALGDDGLLSAIVASLEAEGFHVVGVDDLVPDVLAEAKVYGQVEPDLSAREDIEHGVQVARTLGQVDVGQSVVVQQGLVLAVEAIEGTDAMLGRVAGLSREGPGGVLVKIKKPGQERRVDLPTIGKTTIERARDAGLRGIAVEAGGALIIDAPHVTEIADRSGLFLIGVTLE